MNDQRPKGFIFVLLLVAFYYLMRIVLFLASVTGNISFEKEQPSLVVLFVEYSMLFIGALGFIGLYLMLKKKSIGFWITVAICLYTIAFDALCAFAVQSSAIAGLIIPIFLIVYLAIHRSTFLPQRRR